MIAGTVRVGQTLTASSAGIADADGLAGAVFAWQWIANDGTADADLAGATGSTYILTAVEAGKTVKVRVTFTDDGGTEETLVSAREGGGRGGASRGFDRGRFVAGDGGERGRVHAPAHRPGLVAADGVGVGPDRRARCCRGRWTRR